MPKVVRCPNCHAPLTVEDTQQAVIHCQYCGYDAKQTMFAQPAPRPVVAPVQVSPHASKNLKIILIVIVATTVLPLLALPALFCGIGATVTNTIVKTATQPVVVSSSSGGPFVPGGGGLTVRRAPAEPDTEPEADRLLAAKLEAASDVLNNNSPRVFQSRARYLGWVRDPVAGPTCKESCISWGLYTITLSGTTKENLGQLPAMRPPLAFDAAVPRYSGALVELEKVLKEADRYYDQKDYLEDGCAKGQELHKRLMPHFESLAKADAEIRAVLERELPALWSRRLKLIEREDPGGQLARSLALLTEARALVDRIQDRDAGRGGDGADAALRTQIQRFSDTIDRAGSGPEGKPLRHPKWLYRVDTWVQGASTELLKVAKEYARGELRRWKDPLRQVTDKYNDFLRHLRGAGVTILNVNQDRCR
jgi:hypothetical protein